MHRPLLVIVLLSLVGCDNREPLPVRGDPLAKNYPLFSIEMDPQRKMDFDPAQPYRLEFGRGSGGDGFNNISIDEEGHVEKRRPNPGTDQDGNRYFLETAHSSIDLKTRQRIADLICDLKLLEMNRAYHADVADGSQWEFRLTQGEAEKTIYCNNYFPEPIQDFAVALDRELMDAETDVTEWEPVYEEPEQESESK